jgi:hypothetical protein
MMSFTFSPAFSAGEFGVTKLTAVVREVAAEHRERLRERDRVRRDHAAANRLLHHLGRFLQHLLRFGARLRVAVAQRHQFGGLAAQRHRFVEQFAVDAAAADARLRKRERLNAAERGPHAGPRVFGQRVRFRLRLFERLAGDRGFDRREFLRNGFDVLALAGRGIDRVAQRLQLARHRGGVRLRAGLLERVERLAHFVHVFAALERLFNGVAERHEIDRLGVLCGSAECQCERADREQRTVHDSVSETDVRTGYTNSTQVRPRSKPARVTGARMWTARFLWSGHSVTGVSSEPRPKGRWVRCATTNARSGAPPVALAGEVRRSRKLRSRSESLRGRDLFIVAPADVALR